MKGGILVIECKVLECGQVVVLKVVDCVLSRVPKCLSGELIPYFIE